MKRQAWHGSGAIGEQPRMTLSEAVSAIIQEMNIRGGVSPKRFALPQKDWVSVLDELTERCKLFNEFPASDKATAQEGYENFLLLGVPVIVEEAQHG